MKPRLSALRLLPLAGFAALAFIFYLRIGAGDPSTLPSALIGKDVPVFALPALDKSGVPAFSYADLKKGRMTLVNVWASWCVPCRDEHLYLLELKAMSKETGFDIAGINYKDRPEAALKFLSEGGNPYTHIGVDADGRTGIDWGVYGVPETFVVDGAGKIVFKHVGPLDRSVMMKDILPRLRKPAS